MGPAHGQALGSGVNSLDRLTILLVKLLYPKGVLPVFQAVEIEFIPSGHRREGGSRNLREGMERRETENCKAGGVSDNREDEDDDDV